MRTLGPSSAGRFYARECHVVERHSCPPQYSAPQTAPWIGDGEARAGPPCDHDALRSGAREQGSRLRIARRYRVVALGRRNCLFCGADEDARRHAIISTVPGNCALAGVNPFTYLREVIAKLTGDWPSARIAELMPAAQKQAEDAHAQ